MTWLGVGITVSLGTFEALVLWRYPEFRRAFFDHWRPSAVAKRMDAWAKEWER